MFIHLLVINGRDEAESIDADDGHVPDLLTVLNPITIFTCI